MTRLAPLLILLSALGSLSVAPAELARCYGGKCRACRNCSMCTHCNAGNGACSVCAHHESPE